MNIMRNSIGLTAAITLTTSLALAFVADVEATPPGTTGSRAVVVHYSHLDLDREADRSALLRTLRRAAGKACGGYDNRDLAGRAAWHACRDTALADAVDRIGDARLAGQRRKAS